MDFHPIATGVAGAAGVVIAAFLTWFKRTDFDVSFRIKTKARRINYVLTKKVRGRLRPIISGGRLS